MYKCQECGRRSAKPFSRCPKCRSVDIDVDTELKEEAKTLPVGEEEYQNLLFSAAAEKLRWGLCGTAGCPHEIDVRESWMVGGYCAHHYESGKAKLEEAKRLLGQMEGNRPTNEEAIKKVTDTINAIPVEEVHPNHPQVVRIGPCATLLHEEGWGGRHDFIPNGEGDIVEHRYWRTPMSAEVRLMPVAEARDLWQALVKQGWRKW